MEVTLLEASANPANKVKLAMTITMSSDFSVSTKPITKKQCAFLLDAEHTSLFEHVFYTFLVKGVSRSFLAQITRQRMASPTSGSQHYQDYSNYPCAVSQRLLDVVKIPSIHVINSPNAIIETVFEEYTMYLEMGLPREEARQILPSAATVNYLWTINARSLIHFLRHRLCCRNCEEMIIFSMRVLTLCQKHFPELFDLVHRMCWMDGRCKQGHLRPKECPAYISLTTGAVDKWILQTYLGK